MWGGLGARSTSEGICLKCKRFTVDNSPRSAPEALTPAPMLPSVLRRHRHSLLARAAAAAAAPSSHPELSLLSPLLSPQHGWQGQGSHSQPGCGQGQQQQEGEQEGSLAGGLHGCQPHLHAPRALHTSCSSSCSAGSWGISSRRGDRGRALASSPAARGLATLAPDRVSESGQPRTHAHARSCKHAHGRRPSLAGPPAPSCVCPQPHPTRHAHMRAGHRPGHRAQRATALPAPRAPPAHPPGPGVHVPGAAGAQGAHV